jgi:hypothetical protein
VLNWRPLGREVKRRKTLALAFSPVLVLSSTSVFTNVLPLLVHTETKYIEKLIHNMTVRLTGYQK